MSIFGDHCCGDAETMFCPIKALSAIWQNMTAQNNTLWLISGKHSSTDIISIDFGKKTIPVFGLKKRKMLMASSSQEQDLLGTEQK